MRFQNLRRLHTSRIVQGFRRSSDDAASGKKTSTPRKANGEYRWYEKAVPYSKFDKNAPQIPRDSIHVPVASKDILAELKPTNLVTWPREVQAQLFHLGSYKPDQQFELFNERVSLIRKETIDLLQKYLKPGKSTVLTGDGGVGKTSMLTQAHAAAKLQNWAVIHITRAGDLLDGTTNAVYNEATKKWDQPMFMSRLATKTLKANKDLPEQNLAIKSSNTLQQLAEIIGKDQKVLVTVDNLNAISNQVYAKNTDTENQKLYHDQLEVVSTFLKWFKAPPANIAVIGATCGAIKPIDWEGYAYAPLTDFDPELVNKLKGAERYEIGHLSGLETEAYVEYLHAVEVTQKSWQELFQSGNGNPRSVLAEAINFSY